MAEGLFSTYHIMLIRRLEHTACYINDCFNRNINGRYSAILNILGAIQYHRFGEAVNLLNLSGRNLIDISGPR